MRSARPATVLAVVAFLAAVVAAVTLHAAGGADAAVTPGVVGTGWQPYTAPMTLQIMSHGKYTTYPSSTTHASGPGGSYDRAGGVETFKLFNHDASNRVEWRAHNDYTTGMRQFEGDLRVSGPTNNESCMQIFGEVGGSSMLMIRAYSAGGGTLRALGSGATLATGIYGRWLHLNVIHDATANKVTIYVNDRSIGTWSTPRGTHYFKYGIYGTLTTATAQTEWRNVTFYRK